MELTRLDWIEVARTGKHPGKVPLTRALFDSLVRNFLPEETPVVVGHPGTDRPAYGWLRALEVRPNDETGDERGWSLWMKCAVTDGFYEALRAGHYRTRSISIDRTDDGKGWMLLHVGFLGAAAPAIRGMEPLRLAAAEVADERRYEFAGHGDRNRSFPAKEEAMRKCLKCGHVLGEHDRYCPECGTAFAAEGEPKPTAGDGETRPESPGTGDPEKPAADDGDAFARDGDRRIAELERKLRTSEAKAEIDALVADGRLTPAQAAGLAEFAAALPDDGEDLEFSLAGKKEKGSPRTFFSAWLRTLPKQVELGEFARRSVATIGDVEVDLGDREALDRAARKYQADKQCTYAEALDAIVAQAAAE